MQLIIQGNKLDKFIIQERKKYVCKNLFVKNNIGYQLLSIKINKLEISHSLHIG